jgi:FG-GAP-like repeat
VSCGGSEGGSTSSISQSLRCTGGLVLTLVVVVLAPSTAQALSFTSQSHGAGPAGSFPITVVSGNFNRDSAPDLAVTNNGSNSVAIRLGPNYDGTTSFPVAGQPVGLAAADLNGDTGVDLAVANQSPARISILLGNGDGSFRPTDFETQNGAYPATGVPLQIAIGDFDGDTNPDLAVTTAPAGSFPSGLEIMFGQGITGDVSPMLHVASGNFHGVVAADFNGDTKLDIATTNQDTNTVAIALGRGNGTFLPLTSYGVGALPGSLAVGDFDGDGKLDLAVANKNSANVSILRGNGDGTFTGAVNFAAGTTPTGVAIGDFDTDGRPDLAVSNSGSNNVSILLGNGDGTFGAPANFTTPCCPASVAVGDFNADGQHDFVTANSLSNNLAIQLNTTPYPGYSRPKGATPMRASLVPAYRACTASNRTHGAPLSFGSCAPPAPSSPNLTVGTPDANGAPANAIGSVLLSVKTNVAPTPNDVLLAATTSDVRCQAGVTTCGAANAADGPDYTGELQVTTSLRITDRLNGYFKNAPGTVVDTPLAFTVPCAATASVGTGATCSVSTTANSIVPGIAKNGSRQIWELGNVQVFDGGPDGAVATAGNSLFEDQGVFVP